MKKVSVMLLMFALLVVFHYGVEVEARGPIATCSCNTAADCPLAIGCLVCHEPSTCRCINNMCFLEVENQFPSPAINMQFH
ncbi:hypothetical protein LINGRAHAP2_LOCUS31059 [Linum grandiflorum]